MWYTGGGSWNNSYQQVFSTKSGAILGGSSLSTYTASISFDGGTTYQSIQIKLPVISEDYVYYRLA